MIVTHTHAVSVAAVVPVAPPPGADASKYRFIEAPPVIVAPTTSGVVKMPAKAPAGAVSKAPAGPAAVAAAPAPTTAAPTVATAPAPIPVGATHHLTSHSTQLYIFVLPDASSLQAR